MTLIEKLETAEAGSRELSDEVLLALGWMEGPLNTTIWYRPDYSVVPESENLEPTTNLQDAVDLVPEGWDWGAGYGHENGDPEGEEVIFAVVGKPDKGLSTPGEANAATPALALCAAILRAKEVT